MQHLTVKIPDNKMAFFLELINSLGFVKVETGEGFSNVLSQEQRDLVEVERNEIKQNTDYLLNWDEARKTLKLD